MRLCALGLDERTIIRVPQQAEFLSVRLRPTEEQ